ncbi:uncharacterized protein LOC101856146 [Aplysia californica]|uniref:Uncharacterized protein LOC101856146 n=1 Tax=Aplysia californica TaxID=6500 RepID=A0ABM0K9K2_APLCA|nr:uncharacterized protein LOC101856146 [Aplysia californica]
MEGFVDNSTSLVEKLPRFVQLPGLLSSQDYEVVRIVILLIIDPFLYLFGITSNVINIRVFCKMGTQDTVSVSFLALSISDLWYLFAQIPVTVCYLPSRFFSKSVQNTADMPALGIVVSRYSQIPYDFSIFIATYVAVTRCFCVTFPLKFGGIFTRSRTIMVLCVALATIVILYIPILSFQWFSYRFDPRRNVTRLTGSLAPEWVVWDPIHTTIFKNVYINICFITCCISTVILILNLSFAARTRQKITGGWEHIGTKPSSAESQTTTMDGTATAGKETSSKEHKSMKGSSSKPDKKTLSSRDTQVIKSVILVTLMFICTHIPVVIFVDIIKLFEPEFNYLGRYAKLVLSSFMLARSVVISSSACNCLVYFNFNTKYRETLKALFSRRE